MKGSKLVITAKDINQSILEHLEYEFGSFYFFRNFIISEIKTGVIIDFEKIKPAFQNVIKHYRRDIPFVYISNRINSYSVVPTSHFQTRDIFPNLMGYAIVSYNPKTDKVAELERSFFDKHLEIFDSLDKAIKWAETISFQ